MGYIIAIAILSAILLISWAVIWNLMTKNEKAEDMIVKRDDVITNFLEVIKFCDEKLKQIDAAGTFRSDDEVGFFFKQIKGLQEMLNQYRSK
jgi:uncharacterized membrane protein